MNTKKEKLEDFKTAISSTVRSLSNSQKIQVFFGNHVSNTDKISIQLPDLIQTKNKLNHEEIRAVADSKSLRFRFSNKKTLKKYEPKGIIAKKLYNISEKIRCEKIGTTYFKGVKNNIEKYYQKRISDMDLKSSEDKIVESFENYLRVKFLNFKNENQLSKKFKSYNKDLNEQFKSKIDDLKSLALNQDKFNSLVSELISKMSLDENSDEERKRDEENKTENKQSKSENHEQKTKEVEDKNDEMSIDGGIPDIEHLSKESDQSDEEIEIQDSLRPDLKKKAIQILET